LPGGIGRSVSACALSSAGNRLEAMRGDRQGQYSIRINGQYRICFIWKEENAHGVEITKRYE
jgi:plasmid maintenance system killer protein